MPQSQSAQHSVCTRSERASHTVSVPPCCPRQSPVLPRKRKPWRQAWGLAGAAAHRRPRGSPAEGRQVGRGGQRLTKNSSARRLRTPQQVSSRNQQAKAACAHKNRTTRIKSIQRCQGLAGWAQGRSRRARIPHNGKPQGAPRPSNNRSIGGGAPRNQPRRECVPMD
jgi:hypothetical protein